MPAVVTNAVCGPQVEGTTRPSDWSDLGGLNPCPLNACCNIWGQCEITPEFCTVSESETGAPGTAAPGVNGCISNCGTPTVNNDASVSELLNIGYFGAFGAARSCLNMDTSQLPSSYSHLHFAFGQISSDFNVNLEGYQDQFEQFAKLTYFKCILSFGGWSFSTDLDSYPIFREGVTDANRLTFAQNVVAFVEEYNLDGVDFDWEYLGAPDIPGIPPGSESDGPNHLSFLKTIRELLPAEKSISIAAPASYWYSKRFPIVEMAEILDYIVYMTYDLHGQWDYDNTWVNPGCPNGNCLRSYVNPTETEYALAMITKAGVPANKIAMGIASYSRSFGMEDPTCTAELEQLVSSSSSLRRRDVTSWSDSETDSDIMTYEDNTRVAYMSKDTQGSRINRYASYGFAGAVEWALDLTQLVLDADEVANTDINAAEELFIEALELSEYDTDQFSAYNLTDLATRLIDYDKCTTAEKKAIYSGWQQSWKIMNRIYSEANSGININEAAAVEYLGAPAYTGHYKSDYEKGFKQLASIQPGYLGWFSWRLAVRCDDFKFQCPCRIDTGVTAYTVQNDPKYQVVSIKFCPRYFSLDTLDNKISQHADKSQIVNVYADLENYHENQGSAWFHELTHVDWAWLKASPHVTDIKIGFKNSKKVMKWYDAYGPLLAKSLARLGDPGYWTMRNADNLSLYALASVNQDGTGELEPDANITEWSLTQGVCAARGDVDGAAKTSALMTVTGFPVASEYPSDYLSSWSSWAGLAPATTTTPTPVATWTVSIYSKEDCQGDHYLVTGHNMNSLDNECAVMTDLNTTDTSTTVSCRWYTDGSWNSCDEISLTHPLSWKLTDDGTICTAYDNDICDFNGSEQAYLAINGCINYSEDNFEQKMWIAVQCGHT